MNITTEQKENIVIDFGVVYLDYNETSERILAPCKGGNEFEVIQKIAKIDFDGMKSENMKGLKRILTEDAKLTVNLLNMSQENLHLALPGSVLNSTTGVITSGDGTIADTEYLKNITLIGKTLGGEYKIISLFNAMSDGGVKVKTSDKDEPILGITFFAHRDPEAQENPIYEINHVSELL